MHQYCTMVSLQLSPFLVEYSITNHSIIKMHPCPNMASLPFICGYYKGVSVSHHSIIAMHFCPISVIVVHPVSDDDIITVHLCLIMVLLPSICVRSQHYYSASHVYSQYYYHTFHLCSQHVHSVSIHGMCIPCVLMACAFHPIMAFAKHLSYLSPLTMHCCVGSRHFQHLSHALLVVLLQCNTACSDHGICSLLYPDDNIT